MTVVIVIKGALLTTAYAYSAYTDIKTREIPDAVPVVILLTGCINISVARSLIGFGIIGLVFLFAAVYGNMGGGDIKLMAASGFALGLWGGIMQTIIGLSAAILYAVVRYYLVGKLLPSVPNESTASTSPSATSSKPVARTATATSFKNTGIPLAPFLGVGGVVAFLTLNIQ